ncbi:MAG: hypothetical protein ACTHY8_07350 [Microbacterium gubbeenense]|uniref:hypothetical protein n=1 Tax=Microbacterium gubbeenense TaxID=159896 RepID=UPI003F970729
MAFGRRRTEQQDTGEQPAAFDDVLAGGTDADGDSDAPAGGWRRVLRGNRGLWITALVAVVALAGGIVLGQVVVSPFDRAAGAGAPDPGLVTVPVQFGALSNDVTLRGDIGYNDSSELTFDTSSFEGAAIVTGQVPDEGAEVTQLSIALEVTGRPVIVLPGELPAYRTLRIGVSGPDVVQLKEALAAVGIDGGDPASNVFDQATANGVAELYNQAGYPVPEPEEGTREAVTASEQGVRDAEQQVADAEAAVATAGQGASAIEVREADNEIASLWRQISESERAGEDASDLRDQLEVAKLRRQDLDQPKDVSAEQSMLDGAREAVTSAQEALVSAQEAALPFLPASEVLYLDELPRRVDSVAVKRGDALEGSAMTVSGATIQLTAAASSTDVELLEEGTKAVFELPDGTEHPATVTQIAKSDESGRTKVIFEPDPLEPDVMREIQGENVRISIPVGATDGDVLSVPYAALTAGPGGESRVEVVDGDPRDGEDAETRLVVVETGLAAEGYVEVTPAEGDLGEGDLVVVGS